jgi:hypothetical protein
MQALSRKGAAGDYVVIFLSGHGGRTQNNQAWYFLPYDYHSQRHAATALTDRQILDAADVLVKQNKKVFVIIDACFSGQLNLSAQPYLRNYRNPQGGGLVLMLSSSADQTSQALGKYSAFAKAFADSMVVADLDRDGTITLDEIRRDSFQRTHDLIRKAGMNAKQDSEIHWSASINGNMPLARVDGNGNNNANNNPQPQPARDVLTLTGNESLQGFGALSFDLHKGGRAVMHDTTGDSEGTWNANGNQVTLRFANGRVVYTGTLQGNTLSGAARNERTSWTFSVSDANAQPQPQPQPQQNSQTWVGNETLQGFGRLTFEMHRGGRVVMTDAQAVSEGEWQLNGNVVTLRFDNGRVVYTGNVNGNTIRGAAQNDRTSWDFSVQLAQVR